MKVLGFAGWSGSGKTTLIEQVVRLLTARGLTVSLIKHTHHDLAAESPGKDTWRHRAAGCQEVILASTSRWTLTHELREEPAPGLPGLLARLAPCDVVFVEGYKHEPIPKIEVYRPALGLPPLHPDDPYVVAVACDAPLATRLPCLDLNVPQAVADFVLAYLELPAPPPA